LIYHLIEADNGAGRRALPIGRERSRTMFPASLAPLFSFARLSEAIGAGTLPFLAYALIIPFFNRLSTPGA
jgi:hypothetical protein